MKNIIQPLKTITLALIIGLGIAYAMAWTGPTQGAWTGPTQGPPNGNVPAPVNVGPNGNGTPNGQYKSNYLGIGGIFRTFTNAYLATDKNARVGIGTPNPTKKLDVAGSAKISGALGVGGVLQADAGLTSRSPWTNTILNLFGRDIFTNNDQTLYLNYPNTSGDVEIGGEGETKTLNVKGNVRGKQLCIGGDCRSSWPGGGGGGSSIWTKSGNNIYYNAGDVIIGKNITVQGVTFHPVFVNAGEDSYGSWSTYDPDIKSVKDTCNGIKAGSGKFYTCIPTEERVCTDVSEGAILGNYRTVHCRVNASLRTL